MRPPPVIPTKAQSAFNAAPVWAVSGLVAAMFLAPMAMSLGLPIPVCGMRLLTGLPCPFCGGTRALAALARLDVWGAVALNPLITLGCAGVCAWFVLWLVDRASGRRSVQLGEWACHRAAWVFLVALAALNWVYLCFTLPR